MPRPFIAAAILCAALALPAAAADYVPAPLAGLSEGDVQAAYRADLEQLLTTFGPRNRSFETRPGGREAFERRVKNQMISAAPMTYGRFVMGVAHAVAAAGDAHTRIDFAGLRHVPVRLAWFGDDLRIVAARTEHADLLGVRVTAIGGKAPADLLATLADYVPGPSSRVKAVSPELLDSPDALQGMGVIATADRLELAVEIDGRRRRVSLAGEATDQPALWMVPWRDVAPPHALGPPAGWRQVLDGKAKVPLGLADPDAFYGQPRLPGAPDVLYLRLRSSYDQDKVLALLGRPAARPHPTLQDALYAALYIGVERTRPYEAAIVDLRNNPGGSYFNFLAFAEALPKIVRPGGRIYVLVNNSTFSAAIVATALIKASGGDRVTIVGEPMGDREAFWAEYYVLPLGKSKLKVNVSQGYHDWKDGCERSVVPCWGMNRLFGVAAASLAPDRVIAPTWADYLAGEDTVLRAVTGEIRGAAVTAPGSPSP